MSVLQITKSMIVLILSSELSPLAGMRVRKILTGNRSEPDVRSRSLNGAGLRCGQVQSDFDPA
jgi:hypothetical protein